MKKTTALWVVLCLAFSLNAQHELEIPRLRKQDTLTEHKAYALSYNTRHRQASWVAYQLTKAETNNRFDREDKFIADPLVPKSDNAVDYEGSGYDRGHLAPAADMGFSRETMLESFYFTNMSPQHPSFNRGIWKKLEALVRSWGIAYDTIYIVTGPLLHDSLPGIGPHRVSVPTHYYKVIYTNQGNKPRAIAFLMENEKSSEPLNSFSISVDQLEKQTGLDFFPTLPDAIEEKVEKAFSLEDWKWDGKSKTK